MNDSTYEPRLILNDGCVLQLPGGLSHSGAIAAAECAAETRNDVKYVAARLERNEVAA